VNLWQGFSAVQLGYFSATQAAVITPAQYQSLDADKQETVRQILSTILDDLLVDPTQENAGHCSRSPVRVVVIHAARL